jgi:hypothetical protein
MKINMPVPVKKSKLSRLLVKSAKWVLWIAGIKMLVLVILAFTTVPYYVMHWLGTHDTRLLKDPDILW